MTPQMRRKIVRQLEAVQKAYKLEKQHRRDGQAIITDFYTHNTIGGTDMGVQITLVFG